MATVSFSSSTYRDDEGNGNIQISIMRSGATDNVAIVLITTDNFQGTASGMLVYMYMQIIMHSYCILVWNNCKLMSIY